MLLPQRVVVLQKPAGNTSHLQREAGKVLFLSGEEPAGRGQRAFIPLPTRQEVKSFKSESTKDGGRIAMAGGSPSPLWPWHR